MTDATMQRTEIDVKTPDGVAHAWIYRAQPGARGAVILYVDALGVRDTMHAMAERLAGLGYVVMLPNVFYRAGAFEPFDPVQVWNDPGERERLMSLVRSMTPERLSVDAGPYLDAITGLPDVRKDRIGMTGYCMGGRLSFLTAGMYPDRVRAAASFHGGGLVTDAPNSPHRLIDRIKASIYLGVADEDRGCTPEHQGVLASALAAADVDYRIELYRGKKHGFAVNDHPGVYDEEATERHWRRLESFFSETLGR